MATIEAALRGALWQGWHIGRKHQLTARRREVTTVNVHELALMEDLVAAVIEETREQRVEVVRLEVGRTSGVMVEALSFCFDVCARGTSLEGATLDIIESEGDRLLLREVEVT